MSSNDAVPWLILVAMVLCFKDFTPPPETTNVYLGVCSTESQNQQQCRVTKASALTVFRAVAASQLVVSSEEGAVYRLRDCTVLDARNWTCNTGGFVQTMTNGEYSAPWLTMTRPPGFMA